jgi:cytochrome c oxidase subunit 2
MAGTACDGDPPSTLDPAGPAADRIAGLWWLMFWISLGVLAVVLAMLVVGVARASRSATPDRKARVSWGEPLIIVAGVVIPTVILTAVFLVALRDMSALSAQDEDAGLTIEVTGHDWWWEVAYPDTNAVTANEVHIPAGRPVTLELTTDDVLHSFWVPRLQAKTDMVPGTTNTMSIEASRPGVYRGQCAEFCGLQHANMAFEVVAHEEAAFEEWLAEESRPAAEPVGTSAERGEDVFMSSTCIGCHAIRGTEADQTVGPDLTHFASRRTIAAGTETNDRGNLATWIIDPQSVKPGAVMPPTDLTGNELEALLDYIEGLR